MTAILFYLFAGVLGSYRGVHRKNLEQATGDDKVSVEWFSVD